MLEKIVKKAKKFFSSKMLLIHPSWSRAVPKHPPGPRESFSTILHLKSKIEKQVSFSVDLPNAFFKLVKQPTFQKWILWSNFRPFKTFLKLVLGSRTFENYCLGPGVCLGYTLDQLRWIRNVLEEKSF